MGCLLKDERGKILIQRNYSDKALHTFIGVSSFLATVRYVGQDVGAVKNVLYRLK
jgi:hypothetical protein